MKERFLDYSMNLIQQYHEPYSEDEIARLKYGLEGLYLTITKLVVMAIIAILLHIELEVFLLLLFFNIIRFTGFGVHAERSIDCLISSTLLFVLFPYLIVHISIPIYFKLIITIACLIIYGIYAPADTKKRPLRNQKKRMMRKIATVLIGILYTFLVFLVPNQMITSCLLTAMIIQAIVILPVTYYILGQPYQNWKQKP